MLISWLSLWRTPMNRLDGVGAKIAPKTAPPLCQVSDGGTTACGGLLELQQHVDERPDGGRGRGALALRRCEF